MTRHIRCVEPMHFGCFKLVEQHGLTCRRDEPNGIWLYRAAIEMECTLTCVYVVHV